MNTGIVLYVEDEEDDVFFMRRAFGRAGLPQALKAVGDGQAAIDYLAGQGRFGNRLEFPLPELVLLDLNLPMVSGFQVLKWIRSQAALLHLPVLIFSSSARIEDRLLAKELGADDYIEKPGSSLEFHHLAELLQTKWLTARAATQLASQTATNGSAPDFATIPTSP
jgi:CheY-like chemotaxis protein